MHLQCLPRTTYYDPAEDPPGSVDPLGTVTGAEQLAEVLLPGVTARMWRVRLLTFAVLAAEVARRVSKEHEEQYQEARLTFERLFVSAIARKETESDDWRAAARRLPGIGLARLALVSGDQPLARPNFLKGQAVNGPFGVISRLAKDVGVIGVDGDRAGASTDLLLAWSEDQGLNGVLDDKPGSVGADWIRKLVRQVSLCNEDYQNWPKKYWPGWSELAERLRPDMPGPLELAALRKLISQDALGLRERVVSTLLKPASLAIYHDAVQSNYRGGVEKAVLVSGLRLQNPQDELDRTLNSTIDLIDAYESASGILESVFRGLLWGLTRHHGQARELEVLQDSQLRAFLQKLQAQIGQAAFRFRHCLDEFALDALAAKRDSVDIDRMHRLLEVTEAASQDVGTCVNAVIDRHKQVQKEKRKGHWIEFEKMWTLMPGFGDTSEEPPLYTGYLHPYRVTNMYSMLADLNVMPEIGFGDAQEDE